MQGWALTTAVEVALAHAETFPARADEYGPQLRALLELGQRVSGADYARIEVERRAFGARLHDLFERIDLLLVPPMSTTPRRVAAALEGVEPQGGESANSTLRFTAPFDYSGSPTLSLPGGFTEDGVPLGFQLVARHLEEGLLCRAGQAYEAATEWHQRRPPV